MEREIRLQARTAVGRDLGAIDVACRVRDQKGDKFRDFVCSSAMALNPFAIQILYAIGMSSGILMIERPARLPWPLAPGGA
jgi:hypothetical protein